MMRDDWMGSWGTGYMGVWGGVSMILVVVVAIVVIVAIVRKK